MKMEIFNIYSLNFMKFPTERERHSTPFQVFFSKQFELNRFGYWPVQ